MQSLLQRLLLGNAGGGGGNAPSLNFNFVDGSAFPSAITFTRASTATYFNSAGVLTSAGNNVARFDYNPTTLAARGLLIEEQRTNLLLYSEAFDTVSDWTPTRTSVTVNAAVSPAGSVTADALVIDTTAATNHSIGQNESVTSGTTYTLSVFAKANQITQINLRFNAQFPAGNTFFDLSAGTLQNNGTVVASSITPVGNGWYRCTFTQTASATGTATAQVFLAVANAITIATANGTDNVLLWGAQLEAGAFPTSYIPTTTTALTRNADVASVTTLSPWFNATEGTLFAEGSSFVSAATVALASLDDGGSNNTINIAATNTTGNAFFGMATLGVGQLTGGSVSGTTVPLKAAIGYKTNDTAWSLSGAAAVTDTSVSLPTVTQLQLGRRGAGAILLSGYLRRITYYPRRLSNAQLQAITA